MVAIIFEDFSEQTEYIGGYYLPEGDEIHVDESLPLEQQEEILVAGTSSISLQEYA